MGGSKWIKPTAEQPRFFQERIQQQPVIWVNQRAYSHLISKQAVTCTAQNTPPCFHCWTEVTQVAARQVWRGTTHIRLMYIWSQKIVYMPPIPLQLFLVFTEAPVCAGDFCPLKLTFWQSSLNTHTLTCCTREVGFRVIPSLWQLDTTFPQWTVTMGQSLSHYSEAQNPHLVATTTPHPCSLCSRTWIAYLGQTTAFHPTFPVVWANRAFTLLPQAPSPATQQVTISRARFHRSNKKIHGSVRARVENNCCQLHNQASDNSLKHTSIRRLLQINGPGAEHTDQAKLKAMESRLPCWAKAKKEEKNVFEWFWFFIFYFN